MDDDDDVEDGVTADYNYSDASDDNNNLREESKSRPGSPGAESRRSRFSSRERKSEHKIYFFCFCLI